VAVVGENMKNSQFVEEIERFADLDCPVNYSEGSGALVIAFRQRGMSVKLTFLPSGEVRDERDGGATTVYNSYLGLLASSNFGDLRTLARMQLAQIRNGQTTTSESIDIPIGGDLVEPGQSTSEGSVLEQLDNWTANARTRDPLSAIVIDGPAGIGKTYLISSLVKARAIAFAPASRPLVLHVQSRGRQLTTLPDLLARTLQGMRLLITYEQVPVLARHGLVQLAIDGFDELADPNGYDTAWRSVRDFLAEIQGGGVVILAGRDTFIDAEAVRRALPILSSSAVAALHLRPPSVSQAITWLRESGIEGGKISALEQTHLLNVDGYALRPFFLQQLRAVADSSDGVLQLTSFPLGTLIQAMIERERVLMAPLGLNIDNSLLDDLLHQLFQEAAREMADSESDSIDVPSLQLISEIVFSPHVPDEPLRALRNRIQSVALLDLDFIPERRRFVHSEVHAYFLANAYIRALSSVEMEIPRSVRRNIAGSELLEVFHDVTRSSPVEQVARFRGNSVELLRRRRHDDRSPGNIAALVLASLGSMDIDTSLVIEDVAVDESLIRGVASPVVLKRVSISKLDIRGADASELVFIECQIMSLVVDAVSIVSSSLPLPTVLQVERDTGQITIYQPDEIHDWLVQRGGKASHYHTAENPEGYRSVERLLDKLCRTVMRQSWIRDDEDDRAGRLLRDENWPMLREALLRHGLLEERNGFPAGGRRSQFIRVRRAREIINNERGDAQIAAFFNELEKMIFLP